MDDILAGYNETPTSQTVDSYMAHLRSMIQEGSPENAGLIAAARDIISRLNYSAWWNRQTKRERETEQEKKTTKTKQKRERERKDRFKQKQNDINKRQQKLPLYSTTKVLRFLDLLR